MGATYSLLACWAEGLATARNDRARLDAALRWQQRLGLEHRATAMALAELEPEREREYLQVAGEGETARADALLRLSLLAEFQGKRAEALALMDRAAQRSKQYKTFLAGASQAARLGEEERLLTWSAAALRYCPRDADDVFHLLAKAPRGESVLAAARPAQRVDYLRFLIGQEEYLEALEYQGTLAQTEQTERWRRELCERLILTGQWEEVGRLHKRPAALALENGSFATEPSSLAFDWRLARGEGLQIAWRPGALEVKVPSSDGARELLSQYVRHRGPEALRIRSRWQGEVAGLRWQQERLHQEWVRVALIAEAGGTRAFRLEEVYLEGGND